MRKYLYGREMVETNALRKYRQEHGMKNNELAEKLGVKNYSISTWINTGRVPKRALQKLGITARGKRHTGAPNQGDNLFVCYVDGSQRKAFVSFCSAIGIDAKDVL
jgi:transcriptional regulator with XRE-family HTH domain